MADLAAGTRLEVREAPASYQVMLDSMRVRPGYKQTDPSAGSGQGLGVIPEDWEVKAFKDTCVKIQDGTHFSPTIRGNDYLYVTSKNVRFGFFDVSNADRIDAMQHAAIYKRCDVKRGDLLLTKDGANTGNAALNDLDEEFSLLSSVAFLRFDPQRHVASYFLQQILSTSGQQQIKEAMSGNAITRLTLAKINKLQFPVAPLPEQRAIAAALSDVDALIASLDKLIAKKRDIKQGAMQQLLTGQRRLPGFSGEWEVQRLRELLEYEQPTKYLVKNSEYSDDNDVPVLTAGKTFILGYTNEENRIFNNLPAIIFDDFTTANKYVNFPFKAKSSAMKILKPRDATINLRLVFEMMQLMKFPLGDHKRYWISEYQNLEIKIPNADEQTAIATVLSDMDAEIAALEARRDKTRALKQGMMQELLTGRIRLM